MIQTIQPLAAHQLSAFDRAVRVLAQRPRKTIVEMTAARRFSSVEAIRKEGIALCRAALDHRREIRGTKLARRLTRKVALGRHGAY